MHPHRLAVLIVLLLFAPSASSQSKQTGKANYVLAEKFSAENLRQFVYDSTVSPQWLGKTDTFWYSFRTSKGRTWYRVDPRQRKKELLFHHGKLASQLSELTRKPVDASLLPLNRVSVDEAGVKMKFVVEDFQYEYDLKAEKLSKLGKAPPAPPQFPGRGRTARSTTQQTSTQPPTRGDYRTYSPDRKFYVFARKHNLYLAETGKENEAIQLSKDGSEDYTFGLTFRSTRADTSNPPEDRPARANAAWSPDSRAFYVTRSDSRGVKELFLVNTEASPRPTLEKYKYPMPGEDAIRKTELYVCEPSSRKLTRVKPKWKDESYSDIHWGKTPGELRFIRRDRLYRNAELCSYDVKTGEAKCLLAEGFEAASLELMPVRYLNESDEMIWWSERTGWGHFYLYSRDGKLKNAITSGDYRASQIVAIDPNSRTMWFIANGREAGENVYYQHLYRVKLDGTGLTLLDPGNAHHFSTLSPSREFLVDNCSRIDQVPVSVLRDARGQKVMDLEKADLSRLIEFGWKMPSTFTVKAADGVTELYGNMWKPFDFDPKKKYPIIANVYPGPQTEGVTHTFLPISPQQQLAQLGFIVLQVGHRGGTPTRSKAYHAFGYYNLRDYGLADKKAAIEQLAARHSFIDINKVGIYGHSGGGFMSAAAVLQKPYNEFFKAAVATAGNHDNNVYGHYWAERYHGLKEVVVKKDEKKAAQGDSKSASDKSTQGHKETQTETRFEIKVPTNAELAANLKGALLLVHGDLDNNVHPAGTMRLVSALIKANKRFELLILPGARHAFGEYTPYVQQKTWDFFVDHLLGERHRSADIREKDGGNPR